MTQSIILLLMALLNLPNIFSRKVHTTSYGGVCISPCAQTDTDYYWCKQKGGSDSSWDYCSPEEGYDSYFSKCLSGCQRIKSLPYEQCFSGRGWSYCGQIIEEFEDYYTTDNTPCVSDCILSEEHFICTDTDGYERECSPLQDVTSIGEPCRLDHRCNFHGYKYTWCYIDYENHWGYCGKVNSDCYGNYRVEISNNEEICRVRDTGNRYEIVLTADTIYTLVRPSRELFQEASRLINRINSQFCFPNHARVIITDDNIRMDMQGSFEEDGVRYLNVQLQLNHHRAPGESTSIAQIIFPQDLDTTVFSRYIRRALQTSMRSAYHDAPSVKVKITITKL